MVKPSITKYESNKHFLLIKIGWGIDIVLPYDKGISLMEALEGADVISNIHTEEKIRINPIDHNQVTASPISVDKLLDIKTAQLLGVTYKEYLNAKSGTTDSTG